MNYLKAMLTIGLCAATTVFAAEEEKEKKKDIVKIGSKLMKVVKPSLVQVEYYLQYSKGQEPSIIGYKCGNCNSFHGSDAAKYVKQDRPVLVPGYLSANNKVITADILVHPRFLKAIKVKHGKSVSTAKISSYFRTQNGLELQLDKPLDGTSAFAFNNKAKKPYFNVSYSTDKGFWMLSFSPFTMAKLVYLYENNLTYCAAKPNSVIVDKQGQVVGFATTSRMAIDNSWKKPPSQWLQYSATEMKTLLKKIEAKVEQSIYRVRLSFRSPKINKAKNRYGYSDRNKVGTEVNTIGLLLDNKRLLVLADLESSATARLENIVAFPIKGKPMIAKFDYTLKDYGMLMAKFDKAVEYSGIKMSQKKILDQLGNLIPVAEIKVAGEKLTTYYKHSRITEFGTGWKGMKYPELPQDETNAFLFNTKGQLLAFPAKRRKKAGMEKSYDSYRPKLTQTANLIKSLSGAKENIDSSNVPVSAEDENRIAWLGIESQPLNPELAKANNISEQTNNGKNGIMITYVYADSPAAKAKLKAGDIILRLYVKGDPSPINIRTREDRRGPFPWSRLENLPEMYFDRIPAPWQSVENSVNKMLTNLGFGKKFTLRCYIDSKVVSKQFSVKQAPAHYENAKKADSKYLGLTVRNITFELRRYFQMKKGAPGIIISKIKPGSKASVSGLKPYEIITQINGKPVKDVSEFDKLINGHKDLQLNVKRMFDSRTVKIKMKQDKKPSKKPKEKSKKQ